MLFKYIIVLKLAQNTNGSTSKWSKTTAGDNATEQQLVDTTLQGNSWWIDTASANLLVDEPATGGWNKASGGG